MKKKNIGYRKKKKILDGVSSFLNSNPNQKFNYKQISKKLNLKSAEERSIVIIVLKELQLKKIIIEEKKGQYILIKNKNYFIGKYDALKNGNGYIISDNFNEDIFIPSNKTNKALHGDEVEFYVNTRRKNNKLQGEITKVLKRNKTEYVGIIQVNKNFAFVIPDNRKINVDIYIPLKKIKEAKEGQKVVVKIVDWPQKADCPTGKIIKILGQPGEHHTEIHSILSEFNLPYEFSKEVLDYTNKIDTSISEKEIKKRKDLRSTLTFTIDPIDAKDFDDALSYKVKENGNYEIGVHIADVSHYVKENTILDDAAYERATSVYLVDRVVPMLPEVLSNKVCSLRPNEEKYTFSVIFEINKRAEILKQWFGKTVIKSDERFSYEEAQYIIENNKQNIPKEISLSKKEKEVSKEIKDAIISLYKLSKIIRKERMNSGAISFDKEEVKFQLDKKNNPKGLFFKKSKESNKLIEEFMLLANKKVAEFINSKKPKKTFIYRVHDTPDLQKLQSLKKISKQFGYDLNISNPTQINSSLNKILKDVSGKKEQNLIDTLAIRSMSKAEYTTENIGHYGLAFDNYSHFTSPIRRYPDVMAHRLLQDYLENKPSKDSAIYKEKCTHSSYMENIATKAERESIKYMQIKYMQDYENNIFEGVISGVTEWGIYVEILENKCEGMIRISDIKEDYFTFDPELYALVGDKTRKKYQLGDIIKIKVKKADLLKRQLDFILN